MARAYHESLQGLPHGEAPGRHELPVRVAHVVDGCNGVGGRLEKLLGVHRDEHWLLDELRLHGDMWGCLCGLVELLFSARSYTSLGCRLNLTRFLDGLLSLLAPRLGQLVEGEEQGVGDLVDELVHDHLVGPVLGWLGANVLSGYRELHLGLLSF